MLLLQTACVPSIEVSPPIISYEALRKSFSAQPLFGYAVQLSSSLLFLYAVNLFCRPRLTGNDSKYPCILYKLSDVFVKIHSQPYHFACSVYHYTSLAPLIFFLHHFVFFQIYISQENIIAAKLFITCQAK
jgi:hypothetical protein